MYNRHQPTASPGGFEAGGTAAASLDRGRSGHLVGAEGVLLPDSISPPSLLPPMRSILYRHSSYALMPPPLAVASLVASPVRARASAPVFPTSFAVDCASISSLSLTNSSLLLVHMMLMLMLGKLLVHPFMLMLMLGGVRFCWPNGLLILRMAS